MALKHFSHNELKMIIGRLAICKQRGLAKAWLLNENGNLNRSFQTESYSSVSLAADNLTKRESRNQAHQAENSNTDVKNQLIGLAVRILHSCTVLLKMLSYEITKCLELSRCLTNLYFLGMCYNYIQRLTLRSAFHQTRIL